MKRNGKKLGLFGTIVVIVIYILLAKVGVIPMQGADGNDSGELVAENTQQPAETAKPTERPEETPEPAKEPEVTQEPEMELTDYGFRNKKLCDSHFEKHGIEMGFETVEDYILAANMVISNPDALYKLEAEDNDHIYFIEETNEFVVLSQDGYIRTYYIANGGIDYFNRQ